MRATGRLVDLKAALAVAAAVPNNRNVIAILSNVRLALNPPGSIEITATDLDCEYRATIPADVKDGCALTVPAALLSDAARLASGDDFALDLDMAGARFVAGKSKYELPILPVTDFPDMAAQGEWQTARLPAGDLARILSHALPFMFRIDGGSSADYVIGGVHIAAVAGQLVATTTDKNRIARSSAPATFTGSPSGILAEKSVTLALRLLDEAEGDVELSMTDSLMRLSCEGQVLTARLLGGPYVQIDRAIPASFEHRATVLASDFKAAIRRASIVGDGKKPWLRMSLTPRALSLTGRATFAFGEATDTIVADYDGEPITFGFMTRHLLDGLSILAGDAVDIHFNEARKAIRLIDPSDPEKLLIVMPIPSGQAERLAA